MNLNDLKKVTKKKHFVNSWNVVLVSKWNDLDNAIFYFMYETCF